MNLCDMSKDSTGGEKKKVRASHRNTYWNSFSFPVSKHYNASTLEKEAT